jgi:TonB family protein
VIGAGSAHEASRADAVQAGARGVRPIALGCAVAASVVVHGALLIATLGGGKPDVGWNRSPGIEATLVQAPPEQALEQPTPVPPVLALLPDRSPVTVPVPNRAPPRAPQPSSAASRPGFGSIEISGAPLVDRTRLGDYFTRQTSEFPVEIDRPVRIDQKIVVRYPDAALAEGREDAVAVWAIVGVDGNVDEVYVAEGSEEFTNEVIAAVRAAHFLPAEDNLKPIRYPIALQFDFRAGGIATARAKPK